jgi:NADP-dependent 3-hydroxy acid dehydrogenase YdfG
MALEAWQNKVALVTGASSGIGRAVALKMAQAGMRVVGCARRLEKLHQLRDEIGEEKFMAIEADLRDEAAILAMFDEIRGTWGGVDVLINNAGLGHQTPLMTGDTEEWREMLDVNVLALCVCTREAIADMRNRGDDGHVIHISSMSAHRVPDGSGVYSATKFAVRSLTEGLRMELRAAKSAIRVGSVSPGFVETGFAERYTKSAEQAQAIYSRFKVLDSDDVADAVFYLLDCPAHVQVHDILIRPTDQQS